MHCLVAGGTGGLASFRYAWLVTPTSNGMSWTKGPFGSPRDMGAYESRQYVSIQIGRFSLLEVFPRDRCHGCVICAKFRRSNEQLDSVSATHVGQLFTEMLVSGDATSDTQSFVPQFFECLSTLEHQHIGHGCPLAPPRHVPSRDRHTFPLLYRFGLKRTVPWPVVSRLTLGGADGYSLGT